MKYLYYSLEQGLFRLQQGMGMCIEQCSVSVECPSWMEQTAAHLAECCHSVQLGWAWLVSVVSVVWFGLGFFGFLFKKTLKIKMYHLVVPCIISPAGMLKSAI